MTASASAARRRRSTAQVLADAPFGDGTCVEVPDEDAGTGCPAVGTASLHLPTTGVADGPHTLTVIAQDAAGNVGTLVDETITVANTPPDNHSTVTITVGSGQTTVPPPGSGPGDGGVAGGGRRERLPLAAAVGVPVAAAAALSPWRPGARAPAARIASSVA